MQVTKRKVNSSPTTISSKLPFPVRCIADDVQWIDISARFIVSLFISMVHSCTHILKRWNLIWIQCHRMLSSFVISASLQIQTRARRASKTMQCFSRIFTQTFFLFEWNSIFAFHWLSSYRKVISGDVQDIHSISDNFFSGGENLEKPSTEIQFNAAKPKIEFSTKVLISITIAGGEVRELNLRLKKHILPIFKLNVFVVTFVMFENATATNRCWFFESYLLCGFPVSI